ncbi:hypothetical protein ENBRE01_3490, partial [Enteropsectra breve]
VQPLVASCQLREMERGVICKTKRVIMEKDLYPKAWGIMDEYEILSESSE